MGDAVHVRGSCYLGFLLSFANGHLFPETFVYAKSYAFPILKSHRSLSVIPGQCCEAYGLTVDARKLEHHYPHALKVKYKGS